MTADLRPYPAYKDSGVEWLGEVPAHWQVRQLGRIGRFMKGGGGTKEDERKDGIPCVRYGDLYTQHRFFVTATRACVAPELANTVYTPIRYGDVLFAGSGETIDEIGKSAVNLIPGPACCGGDVIILRPSIDADARFLGYAMDCAATARQKACIGRGFTVVHIYSSDLKYLKVAIPSLLRDVEGYFVAGYRDGGNAPDKELELVPGAVSDANQFLDGHLDTRARFDRVAELVAGFESSFGLELLSTVHWVITRETPGNLDEAISRVYDWNARKKQFSVRQIGLAADVLANKGWIEPGVLQPDA